MKSQLASRAPRNFVLVIILFLASACGLHAAKDTRLTAYPATVVAGESVTLEAAIESKNWLGLWDSTGGLTVEIWVAGVKQGNVVSGSSGRNVKWNYTSAPGDAGKTLSWYAKFAGNASYNPSQSANQPITVQAPDLIVQSLTLGASHAPPGTSVSVTAYIFNQGTASANRGKVRYYLGRTTAEKWKDLGWGYLPNIGSLAAKNGEEDAINATVPDVAQGDYYILAVADADNDEPNESNEGNNILAKPFHVDPKPQPDLIVQSLTLGASHAPPGTSVSVTSYVYNQGNASANRGVVRYYLGRTTTEKWRELGWGYVPNIGSLAEKSGEEDAISSTIPDIAAGDYYILAVADADNSEPNESSEGNNTLAKPFRVDLKPQPDLIVLRVWSEPAQPVEGQECMLKAEIKNIGTATASAGFANNIEMYFYADGSPLGGPSFDDLAADGVIVLQKTVTAPEDKAYTLKALVDVNNNVTESRKDNNDKTTPWTVLPKAAPEVLAVAPAIANVAVGDSFTVRVTVRNSGGEPGNFDVRLVDKALINNWDVLTPVFANQAFGAGQTRDFTFTVKCTSTGEHTFGGQAKLQEWTHPWPPAGGVEKVSSVVVGQGPGPFALVYPLEGARGILPAPEFKWQPSALAKTYRVEIAIRDLLTGLPVPFTTKKFDVGNLTTWTLHAASALEWNTSYLWRVAAITGTAEKDNDGGWTKFTVMEADPYQLRQYDVAGLFDKLEAHNRLNLVDLPKNQTAGLLDHKGRKLDSTDGKVIVLIHGWNPGGSYAEGHWAAVLSALPNALNGEWTVVPYHWETDASTGWVGLMATESSSAVALKGAHESMNSIEVSNAPVPQGFPFALEPAQDSAERAYQHGLLIGSRLLSQVGKSNLKQIHFVAHSAGNWATYSALRYLAANLDPKTQVQITLLDPFIPDADPTDIHVFKGQLLRDAIAYCRVTNPGAVKADGYYAVDESDIWGVGGFTSIAWSWSLPDGTVGKTDGTAYGDSHWDGHGGPVQFYADTVANPDLAEAQGNGWKRSLAYNDRATFEAEGSLDFGEVEVGKSATRPLAIRNSGTAGLVVSSVKYPPGFSGPPVGTIPAGSSKTINVTFQPDAERKYDSFIEFVCNIGIGRVGLRGTGVLPVFQIVTSASAGGTVSPNGVTQVKKGSSFEALATPASPCFTIQRWLLDGSEAAGPTERFTIPSVEANHTVRVEFAQAQVMVQASATPGGRIVPSGSIMIPCGGSQRFEAVADDGYQFDSWSVDGLPIASGAPLYDLTEITTARTIAATFKRVDTTRPQVEVAFEAKTKAITLRCQGGAGQSYKLEATTDWVHWVEVATLTPDAEGQCPEIPIPNEGRAKFFRVRLAQ